MKYHTQLGIALALLPLLVAVPLGASDFSVAGEGQILQLLSGRYGELFPDGNEADLNAQVLAVEFIGGAVPRRELVPSSGDLSPELSPTLYHDPTVDVTYVLWSSRHNGVHPFLRLAQFTGSAWGETLDITGSVFAAKNDPQLSVHHESWIGAEGSRIERTVFHVLWWESFGASAEKRATALVLENGNLVGSTGILTLGDYTSSEGGGSPVSGALDTRVRLLSTENGIAAAFADGTGLIEVVASEVLPAALSRLALALEDAILSFTPDSGRTLEQVIVDTMIEFGVDFHPATLLVMVEYVLEELAGAGESGQLSLIDLADKAMPHIIHIGAKMRSGGLEGQDVSVITVRPGVNSESSQLHHLAIRSLASFEMPDSEMAEGAQLFISKRGTAALVAWDDGDFVAYLETTSDGGWTDESRLDLTKGIDRATAYRILEERTLER